MPEVSLVALEEEKRRLAAEGRDEPGGIERAANRQARQPARVQAPEQATRPGTAGGVEHATAETQVLPEPGEIERAANRQARQRDRQQEARRPGTESGVEHAAAATDVLHEPGGLERAANRQARERSSAPGVNTPIAEMGVAVAQEIVDQVIIPAVRAGAELSHAASEALAGEPVAEGDVSRGDKGIPGRASDSPAQTLMPENTAANRDFADDRSGGPQSQNFEQLDDSAVQQQFQEELLSRQAEQESDPRREAALQQLDAEAARRRCALEPQMQDLRSRLAEQMTYPERDADTFKLQQLEAQAALWDKLRRNYAFDSFSDPELREQLDRKRGPNPEKPRIFFEGVQPFFYSFDEAADNFYSIELAGVPGNVHVQKLIASRLEIAQKLLAKHKRRMPTTTVALASRGRIDPRKQLSRGLMGHSLGRSVDYNATTNPQIKDPQLVKLLDMVSNNSARMDIQMTREKRRDLIMRLGKETAARIAQGYPEGINPHTPLGQERAVLFARVKEAHQKVTEGSRRFMTDLPKSNIDQLGTLKKEKWDELQKIERQLNPRSHRSRRVGVPIDREALVEQQRVLKDDIREGLRQVFAPWLEKIQDEMVHLPSIASNEYNTLASLSNSLTDPQFVFKGKSNVLDPSVYQLITKGFFTVDLPFLQVMLEVGFDNGGFWTPRLTDPMHFELVEGILSIREPVKKSKRSTRRSR